MNQLTYDNQVPDDSDDNARIEYLSKHFAAYAVEYDFDSIDEYVEDAEINGVLSSDVHNWLVENDTLRHEFDEYMSGVNIESHAETLMTAYVKFLVDPFDGLGDL